MPLDLKMDREHQRSSNQNKEPQTGNPSEGGFNGYGSNDVAGHEKVETKQHLPLDTCSEGVEATLALRSVEDDYRKELVHKSQDDNQYPGDLDHFAHDAGYVDQLFNH